MATVLKTTNTQGAIDELGALLGNRLSTSPAVCEHHGTGETYHAPRPPDAVVFPETTEEVAEIVRICAAHGVPMVPYGVGTSVEGNVCALEGGVTLDMGQMNKVLRVSQEDLDVTVQAGVTRKQLNTYLRDTGLFFPIDPGADATLGGMTATRASGTNAVRYGTLKENVLGLTVVLPGRSDHQDGRTRAEVGGGLRPDPALRRLGGDARRDDRDHAQALRHPRGDFGGGVLLPLAGSSRQHGDPDHPVGHPHRTGGAARRHPDGRLQQVLEARLRAEGHALLRVPRHRAGRRRAGGAGARDRRGVRGLGLPLGDEGGGAERALAGAARCLLRLSRAAAGQEWLGDGRLRADLPSRRVPDRDQGGA